MSGLIEDIKAAEAIFKESIDLIESGDEVMVGSKACFKKIHATLKRARKALTLYQEADNIHWPRKLSAKEKNLISRFTEATKP